MAAQGVEGTERDAAILKGRGQREECLAPSTDRLMFLGSDSTGRFFHRPVSKGIAPRSRERPFVCTNRSRRRIVRNFFLTVLCGVALGIGSATAAEIVVKVRPPRAVVERRSVRPGRDYIWVAGYHRWNGNRYVWEAGRWDRPPHPHAVWVAPRWRHRHNGWVFVEGRWR